MSVEHAVSLTAMLAEQQIHGLAYVDDAMLYEQPTGHVIRTRNWAQALPEDQRPVFSSRLAGAGGPRGQGGMEIRPHRR